jgi:hypothetical protein
MERPLVRSEDFKVSNEGVAQLDVMGILSRLESIPGNEGHNALALALASAAKDIHQIRVSV